MKIISRLLLAGMLGAVLACGQQENPGEISNQPTDGSEYKPGVEESQQLQKAKANRIAVQHRSLEVLGVTHNSVAFRSKILINNKEYTLTMDQRLEKGQFKIQERTEIIRQTDPGLRLDVGTYRIPDLWNGYENLGIEYRLTREGGGISSQFLRITLGSLGTTQVVLKQKFEYPVQSDLVSWSKY